jgi:alkanesulfonate monooxygenase SsuD/methylene tetrahydromethanopterin reductase-like flavin-dependent oxidoreductase (luciferase family)
MGLRIGFKTSPQAVDWSTLDETWAAAGEQSIFDAGWLNDHLVDIVPDRGHASYEALTLLAALARKVPGKWVGHAVLSNTFRHPAVLAKAATVLDHVTGGRFILGLGAGWLETEHGPFGIALPPIGERIDRLVSAVGVLEALFAPEATSPPGVTRPDAFYPLDGAINQPPPITPGGPPIYLGGQKRRGIELAARSAAGWVMPGDRAGDVAYLGDRRDALMRAFEAIGRDPAGFAFVGQVVAGSSSADRREALDAGRRFAKAGATEMIVGITASAGPDALLLAAREVAEPLAEATAALETARR